MTIEVQVTTFDQRSPLIAQTESCLCGLTNSTSQTTTDLYMCQHMGSKSCLHWGEATALAAEPTGQLSELYLIA